MAPPFGGWGASGRSRAGLAFARARRTNGIRPSQFQAHDKSAPNAKNYGSGGRSGPSTHPRARGRAAGRPCNWPRRTAAALSNLGPAQPPPACRTRGTPCSSAATLHLAVVFRRPCLTLVRPWQPRRPDAYPNWSPLPFSAVRRDSGPHSWACQSIRPSFTACALSWSAFIVESADDLP